MVIRRFVLALCLIAATTVTSAQEFDVFDRSDFLDPRLRGVTFVPDENGIRFSDEMPFLLSRISLGGISDYYYRTAPTGARVAVAHLATSYYHGRHQFNLKLTNFSTQSGSFGDVEAIPRHRATLQWAVYVARPDPLPPKGADASDEPPIILSRYLLSAAVEQPQRIGRGPFPGENEGRDVRGAGRDYEVGAEMDIRVPGINVIGTLSYANRHAVSGTTQRFAYVSRTGQQNFHRLRIDMSIGYVAQKAEKWQWGNVRPAFHMRIPLDRASTAIHVAYAPTISVIGGVRMRHEFAAFVDRALIAHVFRHAAPASGSD